jgi:hypothetical protein
MLGAMLRNIDQVWKRHFSISEPDALDLRETTCCVASRLWCVRYTNVVGAVRWLLEIEGNDSG